VGAAWVAGHGWRYGMGRHTGKRPVSSEGEAHRGPWGTGASVRAGPGSGVGSAPGRRGNRERGKRRGDVRALARGSAEERGKERCHARQAEEKTVLLSSRLSAGS